MTRQHAAKPVYSIPLCRTCEHWSQTPCVISHREVANGVGWCNWIGPEGSGGMKTNHDFGCTLHKPMETKTQSKTVDETELRRLVEIWRVYSKTVVDTVSLEAVTNRLENVLNGGKA